MRPVLCNAQFICMVSQLGMDKYRFKLHMKGLYSVPLEVELAHRIYITSLCNVTYCMLKAHVRKYLQVSATHDI